MHEEECYLQKVMKETPIQEDFFFSFM